MRLSRLAQLSLPALLIAAGYLGYEGCLLRLEAAAFQSGRYGDAARLAGPVALMRRSLTEQLQSQIADLETRGAYADQLPLLEKLAAIAPDPALTRRLAGARVAAAPASAIAVTTAEVIWDLDPPAAPPTDALFRAEPLAGKRTDWGSLCRLEHRAPDGTWLSLGEGFSGPFGASFELQPTGQALLMAGDDAIERWDLQTGGLERLTTTGTPLFLAAQPKGAAVAYSVSGDTGDTLWLLDGGRSRQIYPAAGAPALPWLGLSWAPDGQSLVAVYEAPEGATRLIWLSPSGDVRLEATLDGPPEAHVPRWIASPDGRRVLLMAGAEAWVDAGEAAGPRPIDARGHLLGWSPDGQKLAGLADDAVFVLDVAAAGHRTEQAFPGLPAIFDDEPARFSWVGDRLSAAGVAALDEASPPRPARLDVTLGARD